MTCPIPGGFLVAIEGIDGSGKTTQTQLLAKFCKENRLAHAMSKEPTKGKYGSKIRDSAIRGRLSVAEEIEILDNDRREHVETVIAPALGAEKIVILDRYYFQRLLIRVHMVRTPIGFLQKMKNSRHNRIC
jgi:dTMP kinase